jgi:putative flippase GtrA
VSTEAGKSGSWFGSVRSALFARRSLGRYGLLGLIGLGLDLAVFAALIAVLVLPVLATVVSSFVGIVTNYVLNARFNFHQALNRNQLVKFLVVGALGLGFAALLLQVFIWWGAGVWLAKIVSLVIVVLGQYSANRLWTFR